MDSTERINGQDWRRGYLLLINTDLGPHLLKADSSPHLSAYCIFFLQI
jgi:hypothetical protein